jgi:hypothetical protein
MRVFSHGYSNVKKYSVLRIFKATKQAGCMLILPKDIYPFGLKNTQKQEIGQFTFITQMTCSAYN